jgi:hypothetical protein
MVKQPNDQVSQPLPGLAQEVGHKDWPGRDFRELSESGLLWLINAVVFHPRGFALALSMDTLTGQVTGWDILGDGTEPWQYADDMHARFVAAEATLEVYRSSEALVEQGLQENLRRGFIEQTGTDGDGNPTYRMTEAGVQHVQEMGGPRND